MAENPQSPLELNLSEWEFLPDNTSCLELGLQDFKTFISNEVIDTDYFRSEPCDFIQQFSDINIQDDEKEEEETKINPKEKEPMECTKSARSDPKQSTAKISVQEIDPPPPSLVVEEKIGVREEEKEMEIWEGIRVGNWKCRLAAIGSLCSIRVAATAAAIICVLALGACEVQPPPQRRRRRSPVVQFRDDKMLAGVVEKAGKLNQALAVARGMPAMARAANISFGGYYSRPLINSRLSPSDDTCSCSFRGRP